MRAVKSVSIDSERRVIITYLDGSTETLYPNCIWCDSEALRQLIKDLLEEKADAITQTIENVTIATFADGADEGLIKKLLVSIDPIQEGTGDPSPENVRPISGRTGLSVVRSGKNLLGGSAMGQSIVDAINNPTYSYMGEDSNGKYVTLLAGNQIQHVNLFPKMKFKENTVYSLIVKITRYQEGQNLNSNVAFHYTDGTFAWFTFNASSDTEVIKMSAKSASGKTVQAITGFWGDGTSRIFYEESGIFEGSVEVVGYEPYKGSTYSVNWETEAGTVYGGTLDVVSGKLTVDRGYSKLSDLASWGANSNLTNGTMRAVIPNVLKPKTVEITTAIMDCRKPAAYGPLQPTWTSFFAISYDGRVVVPMNRTITVEEFLSEYGNHEVCYPLATPIEIQLTPQEVRTLLGVNNIWADSGNIMELEYTADTKLYIAEQPSGTLGSGMQTNAIPNLQPVSEKTWEDVTEAYKEEATDERGEE